MTEAQILKMLNAMVENCAKMADEHGDGCLTESGRVVATQIAIKIRELKSNIPN